MSMARKTAAAVMAFILCLAVSLCSLTACQGSDSPYDCERTSYAMGSLVTQKLCGGDADTLFEAEKAIAALDKEITYRGTDGTVSRLNADGSASLSDDISLLLSQALELSAATHGKFDITVLPLVRAWGFDSDTPSLPSDTAIAEALAHVGYKKLTLDGDTAVLSDGVTIDLSSAGKGAACEKAVEIYRSHGATGGVVTVGGSVGVFGKKPGSENGFVIAVRDPFDPSASLMLGTLILTDSYISTSGSYEKAFSSSGKTYHHLLDALTGYPAESGLVSVTVICDDGGLSDMLASAFFCIGVDASLPLMSRYSAEAIFVTSDAHVLVTPGIADKFSASYPVTVLEP